MCLICLPQLLSEVSKYFVHEEIYQNLIISDNANSFKSAAKTLGSIIAHPDVKRYSSQLSFEWKFNLEKAPDGDEYLNAGLGQLNSV